MGNRAFLVVDAEAHWEGFRQELHRDLKVELVRVATALRARELLQQRIFVAAALAESPAGLDSLGLLKELKEGYPSLPVFILSPRPTVAGAVAAMRAGAQDYIGTPLSWEHLAALLTPYLRNGTTISEAVASSRKREQSVPRSFITKDPAVLQILRLAGVVAPTRATVLIEGESGTGKEMLARHLHTHSDRSEGPFVAVNCAALPEGLLESELFGHEKGAFTGAIMRKAGKFELAQNGTLLLDEISEMHPHLQAKLLRVLQENEIDRVGGRQPIALNVRVIATTNRRLPDLIRGGRFREDLYYRLRVISFTLPPLRARQGDIRPLAEHFLARYSGLFSRVGLDFSSKAVNALEQAPWPGNVRELENAVARGVLLAQGSLIQPGDLSIDLPEPASPGIPAPGVASKPVPLREMEQQLIFQALEETAGNRTHAARLLGISVRTLRNKLHEYRLGGLQAAGSGP